MEQGQTCSCHRREGTLTFVIQTVPSRMLAVMTESLLDVIAFQGYMTWTPVMLQKAFADKFIFGPDQAVYTVDCFNNKESISTVSTQVSIT